METLKWSRGFLWRTATYNGCKFIMIRVLFRGWIAFGKGIDREGRKFRCKALGSDVNVAKCMDAVIGLLMRSAMVDDGEVSG